MGSEEFSIDVDRALKWISRGDECDDLSVLYARRQGRRTAEWNFLATLGMGCDQVFCSRALDTSLYLPSNELISMPKGASRKQKRTTKDDHDVEGRARAPSRSISLSQHFYLATVLTTLTTHYS